MTVQNAGDTAPPPGLSRENIEAVRVARSVRGNGLTPAQHLRDLLAAYDVLAARMAWLASQHAEVMDPTGGLP